MSTPVSTAEDRTMLVKPHQVVVTAWIDINLCDVDNRSRVVPESVKEKYCRLLQLDGGAAWPPVVGEWRDGRFKIKDGRSEYLSFLMLGRAEIFVAWLEEREHCGLEPKPERGTNKELPRRPYLDTVVVDRSELRALVCAAIDQVDHRDLVTRARQMFAKIFGSPFL